jgi:hypothetical protein
LGVLRADGGHFVHASLLRHPGEGRDPPRGLAQVDEWTPAFAGVTNYGFTAFGTGQAAYCPPKLFGAVAVEMARDRGLDLGDGEGLARHLVERLGVDEILVAQHRLELAGIHFRYETLLVTLEQTPKIFRQRPDVADMDMADVEPLRRARRTA